MLTLTPSRRRRLVAALAATAVAASGLTLAAPALADDPAVPVDGAHTSGDTVFPNVGNGGYDALDYDIDIAWTPVYDETAATANRFAQSTIEATSTMTARAEQPLRSFSLDFEGLTVDSVTVNGEPATFTRVQDAAAIKFKLIVTPATPVSGEFTTTVAYSGVPQPHFDADGSQEGWSPVADGAVVLGQPVGMMAAYPHNNTPKDKATYRITLDVPSTITNEAGTGTAAAVSNGELVSKTVSQDGTRTTWDWKQKYPMASELTVIGIGKYDVLESNVTLSSGRTIPEWTFVDSALSEVDKTTIDTRRAQFSTILQGLETMFGPYPGDSTGAIIDTVPGAISYALETQDRSFFPSTRSFNSNTLIHEFVHQWYGNHVSPDDWNGLWMGEGMASWAPTYYNHAIAQTSTTSPSDSYFKTWNDTAATHRYWNIAPSGMTDSATLYGWQTYTRGAMTWEALRQLIGDANFFTLVREWMTLKGGTSQGVDDLQAFAEEISGRNLDAFFQEWVRTPAKPTWPEHSLGTVTSTPTTARLDETVTVTVTADATGSLPLRAVRYAVDLTEALEVASLDTAALPADLTLDGTQLIWTVPATAVGTRASAAFDLTVSDASLPVEADITLTPLTLGGVCDDCATALVVERTELDPIETPVIDGDAQVGRTVRVVTDRYSTGTTTYQWLVDGVAVDGATDRSFTVPASAADAQLSVQVIGTRPSYAVTVATSRPVVVAPGDLRAVPTARVAGKPVVGGTLRAVTGTWDAGVELTYTWLRDGSTIAGATGASYVLTAADRGVAVSVLVTGTKAGYVARESISAAVGPVVAAPLAPPVPPATLGSGKVTLGGKAVAGRTVTAKVSGYSGARATYRWTVGGKTVKTGAKVKLKKAWRGKKVTVTVTLTKAGHTTKTVKKSVRVKR